MDNDEFYKREAYKRTQREYEQERRARQQQEREQARQEYQRQRDEERYRRQDNRDSTKIQERQEIERQRENARGTAEEIKGAASEEIARLQAETTIALKKADILHDRERAERAHELDQELRDRDFSDEVRRANLRVQEHDLTRSIDRFNENRLRDSDHARNIHTLRETLKHKLVDRLAGHMIEKDRMTHATNEEMRLEVFRMELKHKYGDLSDEEIIDILSRNKDQLY